MKKNHKEKGYTKEEFKEIIKQARTRKIETPEGSFTYHFDNGCKLNFEKIENIKGFTKLDTEL
jgi:hypothetical protein